MNSKKVIASAAIACALTVSAPFASADGHKKSGSGPNPFAECGIGAALFKDTHWAAVTSNVTWDLGTTAVTSATMSPETCSARNMQAAQFILDTYENLATETAKGQGENLMAVLDIYGCQQADKGAVINSVRAEMALEVSSEAYTTQSNVEKAAAYYNAVSNAASSCSA